MGDPALYPDIRLVRHMYALSKFMSPSMCSTSGDVSILVGGCRIRGAANYSPITVTDVQSDGRPRAVPRHPPRAPHVRAAVAAARHS
eukprot:scaffold410_cov125-Isochrysis_galbana.AAC.1